MATKFYGPVAPLVQDAINQATKKIDNLYKDNALLIDRITNPMKYMTGGEIASALLVGTGYDVLKGMAESISGFLSGTAIVGVDLLADIGKILNAGNRESMLEAFKDSVYRLGNNVLTTLGTTGASLTAVGTEILTLGLADTTWAQRYTKNLQVLNRAYTYYQTRGIDPAGRFMISGKPIQYTGNVLADAALMDEDNEILRDAYNQQELYTKDYDKRFIGGYDSIIKGSLNFKKYFDKEIFDGITKALGIKQQKELADMLFGDQELYQAFSGVFNSIGAILMAQGLAKYSNAQGFTNPEQSAALASAYFGTQVFGNSFEQAIQNGASIADAYTFASANAVIETAIEQIGGLKLGIDKNVIPTTFQAFLQNGFEEGIEEVMSEFLTPGFDIYSAPIKDRENFKFERMTEKDIVQRMFFAYASGAVAGGFFGVANQYVYNQSLEGKFGLVQQAFKQDITKVGKERAILNLRRRIKQLINSLNSASLKGYKLNKGGGYSLETLSTAEKIQYIRNLGFGHIIDIDVTDLSRGTLGTKDAPLNQEEIDELLNNGYFTFKLRKDFVIDENVFKPIYNNERIDVKEWAVNEATGGETLNNARVGPGKPFTPLTKTNLTSVGKSIMAMAEKSGVPIVVVASDALQPELKKEVAFYINGVIFFNQSAEVEVEVALAEVRKHELIHLIARRLPQQYREIEEEVRSLIDFNQLIQVNPANGTIEINYNADFIKGLFTPEQQKRFFENLDTALADILDSFGGPEKVFALMRLSRNQEVDVDTRKRAANRVRIITESIAVRMAEETTAYFVEAMVKDSAEFVRVIEKQNPNIRERLKNFVARMAQTLREKRFQKQMERIFGANMPSAATLETGEVKPVGKAAEVIERVEEKVTEATRQVVKERDTLGYFYRNFFASKESLRQFINPTILKKYNDDIDLVFESLSRAIQIDPYTKVMEIEGAQYNIEDVFAGVMDFASKKTGKQKTPLQIFSENWKPTGDINNQGLLDAIDSYVDSGLATIDENELEKIKKLTSKKEPYYYFIVGIYKGIVEDEIEALSAGLGKANEKEAEEMRKKLKVLKTRLGILSLFENELYPSRPITNPLDYDSVYEKENMAAKDFQNMGAIFGDSTFNVVSVLDSIQNNKLSNKNENTNMGFLPIINQSATLSDYFKKNTQLILDKDTKIKLFIIAEYNIINYAKNIVKKNISSVPAERGSTRAKVVSKIKKQARKTLTVAQKTLSHAAYNATQRLANWISNNQLQVPPFLQGANFINSSFSTFDINNPGGIYVEIDLSEELKQLKTKEKRDYLDTVKQSYDIMLHAFLEGTHITSTNKKIKFGLDDYQYEVEILEKDVFGKKTVKSEDIGFSVFIYPTVKNIKEYIEKLTKEEESGLKEPGKNEGASKVVEAKNKFLNITLNESNLSQENVNGVLNNASENIKEKLTTQISNIIPEIIQPEKVSGMAMVNLPWGQRISRNDTFSAAKEVIDGKLKNLIISGEREIRYFVLESALPTGSFYDSYFKDSNHLGTGYYFRNVEANDIQKLDEDIKESIISKKKKFLIGVVVEKQFRLNAQNQKLFDVKDMILAMERYIVNDLTRRELYLKDYSFAPPTISTDPSKQFNPIFDFGGMNTANIQLFYDKVVKPLNQMRVLGESFGGVGRGRQNFVSQFNELTNDLSEEEQKSIEKDYIPEPVYIEELSWHLFNAFFRNLKNPYQTPLTGISKDTQYPYIRAIENYADFNVTQDDFEDFKKKEYEKREKPITPNTIKLVEILYNAKSGVVKLENLLSSIIRSKEGSGYSFLNPFVPTYVNGVLKDVNDNHKYSHPLSSYHKKIEKMLEGSVRLNETKIDIIEKRVLKVIQDSFGVSFDFFTNFLPINFDYNKQNSKEVLDVFYSLFPKAKEVKKIDNVTNEMIWFNDSKNAIYFESDKKFKAMILENLLSIIEKLKKEPKNVRFPSIKLAGSMGGLFMNGSQELEGAFAMSDSKNMLNAIDVFSAFYEYFQQDFTKDTRGLSIFPETEQAPKDTFGENIVSQIIKLRAYFSAYSKYLVYPKAMELSKKDFYDFTKIPPKIAKDYFDSRLYFYETQTDINILEANTNTGFFTYGLDLFKYINLFIKERKLLNQQTAKTILSNLNQINALHALSYLGINEKDIAELFYENVKMNFIHQNIVLSRDIGTGESHTSALNFRQKAKLARSRDDIQNGKITYRSLETLFSTLLLGYGYRAVDLRNASLVVPELIEKNFSILYLSPGGRTAENYSFNKFEIMKEYGNVESPVVTRLSAADLIPTEASGVTVSGSIVGDTESSYLTAKTVEKLIQEPFRIYTLSTTINLDNIGEQVKPLINFQPSIKESLKQDAKEIRFPVAKISPAKLDFYTIDSTGKYLSPEIAAILSKTDPLLRDKEGRILRLYHGTKTLFKDFSYAFLQKVGLAYGPGFYFASDIGTSRGYASVDATRPDTYTASEQELKEEGVLKEVYLNIKKAIYFEDDRSQTRVAKRPDTLFTRQEFTAIIKELLKNETDTNGNIPELVVKIMFEWYFEAKKAPSTYFEPDQTTLSGVNGIEGIKTPEDLATLLLDLSAGFTTVDIFTNKKEMAVPGIVLSTLVRRWRTYLATKYLLQNGGITPSKLDTILKNNKEQDVQGHFRTSVGFTHEEEIEKLLQQYLAKADIENFFYNIWGTSFKDVLNATTEATGYDGIVNRADREGHILVAFNPKQIIDVNDAVSIKESEIEPLVAEQQFNPNSITVIQPYFDAPYIESSFKKAFKLSPIVYSIVPAVWINNKENQKLVDPEKKLVYVERLNTPIPMDTSDNFGKFAGARATNAAVMIWVDRTHPAFKDYEDLRESLETKKRYETTDFVYRFMNKRTVEEDAKVKAVFTDSDNRTSISFAVPFAGVGASYNTKITDFDQIPSTGKYIVIKASSPSVLERLNKIDFGRLAENGAVLQGKGFRASELIEEYNRIKENTEDLFDTLDKGETVYKRVSKKKTSARKINAQEESDIRSIFGDKIIREMLTVDENGNYQVKAKSIPTRVKAEAKITLEGKEYSEKTHAINIPFEKMTPVVSGWNYEVVGLQELASKPYLKLFYEIMKQTNIPFVFTRNWKGRRDNAGGLSFHQRIAFILIDNIEKIYKGLKFQQKLSEILIHENLHELEAEETLHHELAQEFALMLFAVNPSTNTMEISTFGKNFFDELFAPGEPQLANPWESQGFMDFLNYLKGYTYARKYLNAEDISKILRTPKALLKQEKDGANKAKFKGELVAQIGGYLLSDLETVTKVYGLKLTDGQTLTLLQTITKMQANPNNTATGKAFLKIAFEKYKELFDTYVKGLEAQFPSQKRFSVKTLNEFIAKFTDNQFTTKIDLIRTYIKEREGNHRGKATIALDKIIFVASLLGKTVQEASEGFAALKKEFQDLQANALYLLDLNNSDVVKLSDNSIEKLIKQIRSRFKELRDGTETETIVLNRKDVSKQDPAKEFELEEWFLEAKEILEGIKEKYNVIPDEVIKIFGIKEKTEVFQLLTQLSATLQAMEMLFNNDGKWDKQNLTFAEHLVVELEKIEDILAPYFTALNYVKTGALNPVVNPQAVLGGIVQVRTRLENKEIELLKLLFKQKVNSAVNKLMEARIQKDSPPSKMILKMTKYIESMNKNINEDNKTVKEIANSLFEDLKLLVQDAKNSIKENFEGITDPGAYENLTAVSEILNRGIVGLFLELSLMAKDTSVMDKIEQSGFITPEQKKGLLEFYAKRNLKFSASAFATGVSRIINAFATRYESIFGMGQNITNDEYVANLHKQITNLGDQKIRPVVENLWQIMTPQDFLGRLSDFFEGKVDFFPAVLKLFIEATERSEKVSADFHKKYMEFAKNNPGIQKYSVEEVVEISADYLIGLPTDTFQKLVEEINDEIKAEKEAIKAMAEDDTLKEEFNDLKEEKAKLQAEKAKHQRGSSEWLRINKEVRALTSEMSAKRTEINQQKDQIRIAKEAFKNNDFDSRLKVKIAEFLVDNPNIVLNQKMPKGTIAALYLMVAREIEMLEMFEKAREVGEETLIKPTNHFKFSNQINMLDNRLLREVGYKESVAKTQPFTIYETSKVALRDYLKGLLTDPRDQIILDFAKLMFDNNYEVINEQFFARTKTDLPRQETFAPFATLESDYAREFKLALASRYNAGVPDGIVMETVIGAATYLKVENIFSIIENHTRQAAKYNYERFLTDFQNILVNKSATTFTLQNRITNSSSFLGAPNNFLDYFQAMMVAVIGYSPISDSRIEKIASDLLRLGRGARMAFSISSAIKQLGSLQTISVKATGWKKEYQFTALELYKNFLTVKLWRNKFYAKLKEINPNFYLRVVFGSIPDLAKSIDMSFVIQAQNAIEKIVELGVSVAGRMDSDIILSAFKTYFDKIQQANPTMTEEEVFLLANEGVKQVLLYGVANTSRAYRSPFSNSQTFAGKYASRFQSENTLQWSSILRYYWELLNRVQGSDKKLLQSIISLLMSAFFSGLVTFALGSARNVYNEDDKFFELFVNEIIWGNLVGSVPLLNIMTSAIQLDPKTFIRVGFEPELPGIGELVKVAEIINSGLTMQDGSLNMRKVLRVFEQALQPFGIPLASISRLVQTLFGFGAALGNPTSMEVIQWFSGQTDAVALTEAIKAGDRNRINYYISQVYSNVPVQKEMMRLLTSDSSIRMSLKSANVFTAEINGVSKSFNIPQSTRSLYTALTMQALSRLFSRGGYLRMKDSEKAAIAQRVINYYWNHMRNYVINEDGRAKVASGSGIADVIERAIAYENR